jgi:hypothetical protein
MGHAAAAGDRRGVSRRTTGVAIATRPAARHRFTAAAGIFGTYRTFNGIEAGTAFLVLMAR